MCGRLYMLFAALFLVAPLVGCDHDRDDYRHHDRGMDRAADTRYDTGDHVSHARENDYDRDRR